MQTPTQIDAVTYEVVRNALITAAVEMKSIAMRTSYSTVWREAGDLSCAILDRAGNSVAQGPADLPVHLATMPFAVRGALEKMADDRLEEGDVIFHNDPAWGNNHLPDTIMIKPVWFAGQHVGFVAMRGHWTDIGGQAPGSYSAAMTELIQEGLRIPPLKLYRRGKVSQEIVDLIVANTRGERHRRGDLRAQYASCLTGEARLLRLIDKYGASTVLACMDEIMIRAETQARSQIRAIPDGTFGFTDWCDGDGVTRRRIKIQVSVTVAGTDIMIDFTGSARQAVGGVNATLAVTASSVYFAVKCVTDPGSPANSGSYRPIAIIAPEGTVVNAIMPAPVIAGNHETANIIADAVFGALAKAVPDRAIAAGSGSAAIISIGGRFREQDGRPDRAYVHVEPHGGAWGARSSKDGLSGLRVGVGNTGNQPVEVVETEYPLRIREYALAVDSGGPGKFRGGLAPRRVYEVLEDAIVTVTGERVRVAPYGLHGGHSGMQAKFLLQKPSGRTVELPAKTRPIKVRAGTLVTIQPAGGGGFGPPIDRDRARLLADIRDGYVSTQSAESAYGVAVD